MTNLFSSQFHYFSRKVLLNVWIWKVWFPLCLLELEKLENKLESVRSATVHLCSLYIILAIYVPNI